MTQPRPPAHHAVIQAALTDWWLCTDPTEPFTPVDVAEQVELYLLSSGYCIGPDLRRNPMPARRAIAVVVLLAVICTISVVCAALRGDWWWAAIGALAACLLTREGIRDINDRRHGRSAR